MSGSGDSEKKLGAFPFVVAGLSFIPLVGLIFGAVAIVWGLLTRKAGGKKLALVGGLGVGFTVLIYGSLFYFGYAQRGGMYDFLRQKLAQSSLNSLVQSVEFYKLEFGRYPVSLVELKESLPKDSFVSVFDPSDVRSGKRYFYYAVVDENHYYLRGLGADGVAFAKDNIVPEIAQGPHSSLGLLVDTPAQIPPDQSGN
jgi:hypothetical protein